MANTEYITAEMIAPCGLNCAVCKNALQKDNPCRGCHGPHECKPNYCANLCKIPHCDKLLDGFCTCPPNFLCEQLEEKRSRYGSAYQMIERPIDNLLFIRENGMDAFLEKERDYWKCSACGGLMCVQLGECSECGHKAVASQLILVEGMPSTGKTTNSRFIHIQLERSKIESEWVHEVAIPQPVLFFDEVGLTMEEYRKFLERYPQTAEVLNRIAVFRKSTVEINLNWIHWYYEDKINEEAYQALMEFDAWKFPLERYKKFALEKWSSFTEQVMNNPGKVYIIDSAIFQFQIFTFLFQNRPYGELREFIQQITDIIKPLHPALIYLYREDVEATINYLERERGASYLEYLYQRDKDQPYYQDKPAGAEGFKQFLRDYNDLDNQLYRSFTEKKLSLEISRENWMELEDKMLSFFGLQRLPDVVAYPQNGCYINEELGFTIKTDGLSMLDPTGKERRLIVKSKNEFYIDWLPVCLQFENNRIVISGSPIGERWTTSGLQYCKVDLKQ